MIGLSRGKILIVHISHDTYARFSHSLYRAVYRFKNGRLLFVLFVCLFVATLSEFSLLFLVAMFFFIAHEKGFTFYLLCTLYVILLNTHCY